jgi:pyruvate/2-oxoglutarate dehydrogenase complex dihydrolipoamide acyltransferase (E2) component
MSYEAAFTAGLDEIDGLPTLEAAKAALRAAVVEAQKQNEEAAKSELPEDEKVIPPGVKEIDGVVASDAAIALAEANGVDLKLVPATGRDDIIKESDVADYIANNAPLKENADANGSEQSNA